MSETDKKEFHSIIGGDLSLDLTVSIIMANKIYPEVQLAIALEELSELSVQVAKHIRGNVDNRNEILEEMADVQIILEQLRYIFDENDTYDKFLENKIRRFKKIIDKSIG